MSVRRNTPQIRQLPYIIQTSPSPPVANSSMSFAGDKSSSSSSSSGERTGSDNNTESPGPGRDFQQKMQIVGLNVPSPGRRGSNRLGLIYTSEIQPMQCQPLKILFSLKFYFARKFTNSQNESLTKQANKKMILQIRH